jgi:hypothetical protein
MTSNDLQPPSEKEPTVLDLYKSVTRDRRSFFNFLRSLWDARRREEINQTLAQETAQPPEEPLAEPPRTESLPWRSILALLIALGAQALLEPPNRQGTLALALYLFAVGLAVWGMFKNEWHLPALPAIKYLPEPLTTRLVPMLLAAIFALIAFLDFEGGLFKPANTLLWLSSIVLLAYSLWLKTPRMEAVVAAEPRRQKMLRIGITLAVLGVALFFRLHQLNYVPYEPFSDHAEKILDVYRITEGKTLIFFPENTGREAIQFYWTLLVLKVFGTGFTFLSLKLGTILLGILTLPFVYWLGREYGNERVALFALFLFGIAYWPNVISRVGLRFPLYPLFLAPTLLYLVRGLRTHNRNDFILCGIFLGLGLHGYSPFRIVPFFVVAVVLIYLLHARSREDRQRAIWWLAIVVVVSIFIFLPLMRYAIERPDLVGYRALTRLSDMETPLPGPAWQIFLSNLYRGLLMFNWNNGHIWAHSVPNRPALDLVTAALFVFGVVFLVIRYARRRDWRDLVLLASIPILILSSVLSLAFPGENPSLNRTGGAAVTVILISALALDGLVSSFGVEKRRKFIAYGLTGVLFAVSAYQNYGLVFDKYATFFRSSVWNTSELGQVLTQFKERHGQLDTVWIVPFPHWVDTRLPGVWAGIPNRDFAMWQDRLPESLDFPPPKMFLFWSNDPETERILRELYPNGKLTRYTSAVPGKDFYIFLVED